MKEKELHEAFLSDLSALLKKYDAELSLDYDYWLESNVSVIEFKGIYEGDNKRYHSKLDLPSYLD